MLSSSIIVLTLISCNPNVQQDTELVLKLECHKVMQNYLPALSYLHMAPPQAAFAHLKCWWNVREHIEKGGLFLKSLIL